MRVNNRTQIWIFVRLLISRPLAKSNVLPWNVRLLKCRPMITQIGNQIPGVRWERYYRASPSCLFVYNNILSQVNKSELRGNKERMKSANEFRRGREIFWWRKQQENNDFLQLSFSTGLNFSWRSFGNAVKERGRKWTVIWYLFLERLLHKENISKEKLIRQFLFWKRKTNPSRKPFAAAQMRYSLLLSPDFLITRVLNGRKFFK